MKKIAFMIFLALAAAGCKDDKDDDNNNGGSGNSNTVSDQDKTFARKAAMANYAEIQAGQLAQNNSTDSAIMAFGMMMVNDHQSALNELHTIADSLNVYAPDSLDSAHVALAFQLATLTGRNFDSVYIHSQVADHDSALVLFQHEASAGSDTMLKNYASSKVPVIQMHKQLADSLAGQY
jgi:putative membrane protein